MVFSGVDQKYTQKTRGPKVSEKVLFVLFVFSETTWSIGTKFSRNVYLMVLWKVNGFFLVDQKYIKETRGSKVSKRVLFVLIVSLKPLGQLEPNLVGMFIWWFYEKWMFFLDDQMYTKETRGPNVSKSVVLMVSSETTEPIGNKLGRNVHWIVHWEVNGFFVDQKYTKEPKAQMLEKV